VISTPSATRRPPLTLIANGQEWNARSLESILAPHGYAVLRAYNGRQAIERTLSARPDLIIIDTDLPDRSGFDVCRALREHPSISRATPILMTTAGNPSRAKKLEALRAGAWEMLGATLDAEELMLRLDAMISAKLEIDRVRDESLLDEITGLYNLRGLDRRARELGSQAFRSKGALACVVVTPLSSDAEIDVANSSVMVRLARVLLQTGRNSDVIGTMSPGEFAIVAQGTDAEGAERLAQRIAVAAAEQFGNESVHVAVGYDAVLDYSESPIDPSDLLSNASAAMRASRTSAVGGQRVSISRFGATLN
jgi:PleD family two-component response regulator